MEEMTRTIEVEEGIEITVDMEALDDIELMELLTDLQEGSEEKKIMLIPKVITKLLGKEEKAKLYEHYRNEKGRVPMSKMEQAIGAIFHGLGNKKK